MANGQAAWVHPNPLLAGFVVMPDGYQMLRSEAKARGVAIEPWPADQRASSEHPHEKDSVVLARGVVIGTETAREHGFLIARAAGPSSRDAKSAWRSAIMLLPDARNRPAATAELLTSQSPQTLTVEAASAFLRGLPTELDEQEHPTMTDQVDPARAARLAEIQGSVSGFNRAMGYAPRRAPQTASHPARGAGQSEQAKLKRLTEIRLNALSMRGDAQASREARTLKYALDTHATTGGSLANALTQLGVDVAKIMPNN